MPAVLLGALAVGFGIALMTAAGYLISRAAEQPPILSLTVDDRRRALLRPRSAARPLPGADLLARRRSPVARAHPHPLLRADRAARAGSARGLPPRRAAQPHGGGRGRAAGPLSARRRASPRLPSLVSARPPSPRPGRSCRQAAVVLAAGLARRRRRRAAARLGAGPLGRPPSGRRPRRADGRAGGAPARRARSSSPTAARTMRSPASARPTPSSCDSAAATRSPPGPRTRS